MTARAIDAAMAELAGRQHGVFSRDQLLAAGGSDRMVSRRLAAGRWVRVGPGVYGLPGHPGGFRRRLMALVLVAGHGAVVSHEAAAWLHGLAGWPPRRAVVTVAHPRHTRSPLGVVHQLCDHEVVPHTVVDGIPVTTVARTFMDLAALRRRRRLEHSLDDALAQGRVRLGEVEAVLVRLGRRGKTGTRLLRAVLAERAPGPGVAESVLERRARRLLADHGLPQPRWQAPFPGRQPGGGRVDGLYGAERLVIELDGRRWHTRAADFDADRRRDRELTLAGYRLLRFSWPDITTDPDGVARQVREALAMGPSSTAASSTSAAA
jgi:hypothetical protein